MKFRRGAGKVWSSEFWYDLTLGGYIKPEEMLEPDDAVRVTAAIAVIEEFEKEAQEVGLLEIQ